MSNMTRIIFTPEAESRDRYALLFTARTTPETGRPPWLASPAELSTSCRDVGTVGLGAALLEGGRSGT